jgi:hypothetical protein
MMERREEQQLPAAGGGGGSMLMENTIFQIFVGIKPLQRFKKKQENLVINMSDFKEIVSRDSAR